MNGAPAFRKPRSGIEREYDLLGVAGGQRDAGALVEILVVKRLAGAQARGAGFEGETLLFQGADTLLQCPLLRLQIDERDQALTARHGMRAEIKDRCAKTDAERRGATFRHRTDPKGGGKMSPDP
jgi:hypothetical protein